MRTLKAEENSLATLRDDEINFGNKSARAVLKVMRDLILRPVDLKIAGRFNYSADLFDPETVGRMAGSPCDFAGKRHCEARPTHL
jgi:hypothetical protein